MANFKRKYPLSRLRRLRSNQSIRDLVAENKLSIDDLIQPIFVKESIKEKEEIESLVGIFRHSEKSILKEIEELVSLGIKAVATALIPKLTSSSISLRILFSECLKIPTRDSISSFSFMDSLTKIG